MIPLLPETIYLVDLVAADSLNGTAAALLLARGEAALTAGDVAARNAEIRLIIFLAFVNLAQALCRLLFLIHVRPVPPSVKLTGIEPQGAHELQP